jgi:hypothetical protein
VLYLNIEMSESKANWNFLFEKGLIEILIEHKVDSRFKGFRVGGVLQLNSMRNFHWHILQSNNFKIRRRI